MARQRSRPASVQVRVPLTVSHEVASARLWFRYWPWVCHQAGSHPATGVRHSAGRATNRMPRPRGRVLAPQMGAGLNHQTLEIQPCATAGQRHRTLRHLQQFAPFLGQRQSRLCGGSRWAAPLAESPSAQLGCRAQLTPAQPSHHQIRRSTMRFPLLARKGSRSGHAGDDLPPISRLGAIHDPDHDTGGSRAGQLRPSPSWFWLVGGRSRGRFFHGVRLGFSLFLRRYGPRGGPPRARSSTCRARRSGIAKLCRTLTRSRLFCASRRLSRSFSA